MSTSTNLPSQPWWLNHRFDLVVVGLPLLVYIGVTVPLRHWIVDDAGITYAYARCFAQGHGLVAQPGMEPVEGFSNPLWLLALTPFFLFKLFHPYWIPKLLALILTAVTYWCVHRGLMRFTGHRSVSLVVLCCLSLNTSFVVWSCSGLENSLLAALTTLLFWYGLEYTCRANPRPRAAVVAGLLVVGIALTRPDGIAYIAVFPMMLASETFLRHRLSWQKLLTELAKYSVVIVLLYGGFLLFRFAYFGKWLPNTAYAKGAPTISAVIKALTLQGPYLQKWQELSASLFGITLWAVFPLLTLIALAVLLIRSERRPLYLVLLLLLSTSWLVHMILPVDWMGEFRFATPFFAFSYALLGLLGYQILRVCLSSRRIHIVAAGTLIAVSVVATVTIQAPRLQRFYRGPVVAFDRIAEAFASKFNRYADELDLEDASVMLPDIGATLYYSNLRVYDMVGLTDTLMAHALRNDKPLFYDYVFETVRPTFIHTHGNWTFASDLDADARFRHDYTAIEEYPDKWVKDVTGREMMSGNYVRRDAVAGKEHLLAKLR